jgi:hypothetical protein
MVDAFSNRVSSITNQSKEFLACECSKLKLVLVLNKKKPVERGHMLMFLVRLL